MWYLKTPQDKWLCGRSHSRALKCPLDLFNAYWTEVKKKKRDEQRRAELSSPHFLLAAVYKALRVCPSQIWASSLDRCPAPSPPLACRGRQNTSVISSKLVRPEIVLQQTSLIEREVALVVFQPYRLPLVFHSLKNSAKKTKWHHVNHENHVPLNFSCFMLQFQTTSWYEQAPGVLYWSAIQRSAVQIIWGGC